ncbi:nucleoside triphosphate pyrophosphohydrolase [Pontibacillus yanchengensis]|uniref:Nucleoside triphosphate pyrophosphohydrolase n=1 Tax=Pontibacillus yanchengensis TaxID=462910 RepID=A0ACC7VLS2_9BACI|nr:nucleoside triphosphate pyrophosphohydrolase [Pontibacillus yanchengensis]MYL55782.1 nucleoside triphosphate pyrophosphohydrolase [Pontibacillus yanchengensis]
MPTINVIGLGGGDINQLPLGIYRKIRNHDGTVYARTLDHPVVEELEDEGVAFHSFDSLYESHDEFEHVYDHIVQSLMTKAEEEEVLYTVPGHPMLAERTIQLLLRHQEKGNVTVQIQGGTSFLDDLFTSLHIDPIEGFQFVDATDFTRNAISYQQHTIFCQVYDEMIASHLKVELMEDLPHDHPVYIVEAAGSTQERIQQIPLVELDREVTLSNLTSVYLAPVNEEMLNHKFFRLREVIATLRGPEGCPWDKKQTHESLRTYLIEEAYEFLQAVEDEDDEGMIEELGDVLLQIMLHSQIGEDEGFFSVDDVILSVTEKMIRRHPHVFGDKQLDTAEEVVGSWDEIKQKEKGKERPSAMDGVVTTLPGLMRAQELQKKAKKVGFDWNQPEPMWEKVEEEIHEFKESVEQLSAHEQEGELGDILFAMVNLARFYKINPELAIQRTNGKFEKRFKEMERQIEKQEKIMKGMSLDELDQYWELAKQKERSEE